MRIARCTRCGVMAWVNVYNVPVLVGGVSPGEYCAECYDELPILQSHPERTGGRSGPNHNAPGWDDVIRATEEDQ